MQQYKNVKYIKSKDNINIDHKNDTLNKITDGDPYFRCGGDESYLIEIESGFMRVQYRKDGITVDYYNSDFEIENSRTINFELPVFGSFYSDGTYYYILSGQENYYEDDSVECSE